MLKLLYYNNITPSSLYLVLQVVCSKGKTCLPGVVNRKALKPGGREVGLYPYCCTYMYTNRDDGPGAAK